MAIPITNITSSRVGRGATAARAATTVSIAGRHTARAFAAPVMERAFVTARTGGRARRVKPDGPSVSSGPRT